MDVDIPSPPKGYSRPSSYGESSRKKSVLSNLLGVGTALAVAFGTPILPPFAEAGRQILSTYGVLAGTGILFLGFVGGLLLQVSSHEYVHLISDRAFGYDPRMSIELPNPNVVSLEDFKLRRHGITTLIAPFVVLNLIALGVFIASQNPIAILVSVFVLLLNSGGAGSDLYGALFLLSKPKGTLLYSVETADGIETFVYSPESAVA